jgi:hypothetical protein
MLPSLRCIQRVEERYDQVRYPTARGCITDMFAGEMLLLTAFIFALVRLDTRILRDVSAPPSLNGTITPQNGNPSKTILPTSDRR